MVYYALESVKNMAEFHPGIKSDQAPLRKKGLTKSGSCKQEDAVAEALFRAPVFSKACGVIPLFLYLFQHKERNMPQKNLNLQRITEICEKTARKFDYELCDAAMEKEPTGRYLRIYIDKEGGITLDDCEKYHRTVQPSLESFDYDFLEVCSPGIDRPLKTRRDIEKSLGMLVEARLYKPVDGKKSVQGLLREMDENHVLLQSGEAEIDLPRKAVAQVRLVPDLSALDEEEEDTSL